MAYAKDGVRVNSVNPGYTVTDLFGKLPPSVLCMHAPLISDQMALHSCCSNRSIMPCIQSPSVTCISFPAHYPEVHIVGIIP